MKLDLCPWEETIIAAAAAGDTTELQRELDKGTNVDTCDSEYQQTALHWAALNGHHAAVQLLISSGAEINTPEPAGGRTPLLMAVAGGHESVARLLLDAGACADTPDMAGDAPLVLAVKEKKTAMVKLLLEGGAKPNFREWRRGQTPLSLAAEAGLVDVVALLSLHGATAGLADDHDMTAMEYALENGHEDIARTLADAEVGHDSRDAEQVLSDTMARMAAKTQDPYQDIQGEAALLRAVKDGREDVIRTVLESNINVDVRDKEGRTPLSHSAEKDDVETAEILLQKGADVNSRDNTQWTPLMVASERGHEAMISLLLKRGADPDPRDEDGFTPLLHAAAEGTVGAVRLLLDAGADPNAEDESESLTAISRAAENDNTAVVELLLSRKVSPNEDNRTLLCALRDRDREDKIGTDGYNLVKTLVDHGADAFMDGWSDERPIVIASERGLDDIVALFLQADFTSAEIRQEHISDAICQAADEGEKECLRLLMGHYVPGGKETETPWEWAKSNDFEMAYELLQPYFDPEMKEERDDQEEDEEEDKDKKEKGV
ncbi:hypothetical protein ACHAQA_003053 [Verticillium albo-atrum]